MQKQLQHKRFTSMNDASSPSPRCHWYVQIQNSIELADMMNDKYKRPWYVHF